MPEQPKRSESKPSTETPAPIDWSKPQVIDDVTMAFPAYVVEKLLPPRGVIPRDYHEDWIRHIPIEQLGTETCPQGGHLYWLTITSAWFHGAAVMKERRITFVSKEGIDHRLALRHLSACLRSYEPQHEHKIAGVAWLMSQWFDRVEVLADSKSTSRP
jgi:hypothetical protein